MTRSLLSFLTYLITQQLRIMRRRQRRRRQRLLWQSLRCPKIVHLTRLVSHDCKSSCLEFPSRCENLFISLSFISFSFFKLLNDQPKVAPTSSIKKCCPLHQHYKYDFGKRSCANSTLDFQVNAIQAKFYENCIEDEELNVTISIAVENNCKKFVLSPFDSHTKRI